MYIICMLELSSKAPSPLLFFLNCLSTHTRFIFLSPFSSSQIHFLLIAYLLSFNLSPLFQLPSQCIPSMSIYKAINIQYIIKENLENFTTNFKRVGALNNLREKLAVLKVNFPRGEITQKHPMPFKFSRHLKKITNVFFFYFIWLLPTVSCCTASPILTWLNFSAFTDNAIYWSRSSIRLAASPHQDVITDNYGHHHSHSMLKGIEKSSSFSWQTDHNRGFLMFAELLSSPSHHLSGLAFFQGGTEIKQIEHTLKTKQNVKLVDSNYDSLVCVLVSAF